MEAIRAIKIKDIKVFFNIKTGTPLKIKYSNIITRFYILVTQKTRKERWVMKDQDIQCFLFRGEQLLISSEEPELPGRSLMEDLPLKSEGVIDGNTRWGELPRDITPPENTKFIGRRSVWDAMGDEVFSMANRAYSEMDWRRNSLYCSRCGGPLEDADDRGRRCPKCNFITYPVISPAVIIAIEKDDRLLLAHNAGFPEGRYSVIAGFVDLGESLEDTVRREIKEEVDLEVEDITYFGSQSWPFPRSLMLGFKARWKSGDIHEDGQEIVHADWFTVDNIPDIPPSASISRRLIDDFIKRHS